LAFRISRSVCARRFSGCFPFLQFRPQASGGVSEAGDNGTDGDAVAGGVKCRGLISGGFHVDDVYIKLSFMLLLSTLYDRFLFMKADRPYHHGNLKAALLNASLALISEVGPQAFTLREVARRAGVSHNAPYRHFRDKDELLAVVALQGFERLTAAMKRSAARGTTAEERFRLCGRAYVSFALRWPQHFQVMFDLPSSQNKYPEYAKAGDEAFATLLTFIAECQEAGALPAGDPESLALMAWSMVHGIAKLAGSSQLPFNRDAVLAFADKTSQVMTAGMRKELVSSQR
jgi:AcrR family transcriptional regulator